MTSLTMRLLTLISISALVASCANSKDTVLPQAGPTMKQIYDGHFASMNAGSLDHARTEAGGRPLDLHPETRASYTRESATELDLHFPRLPNPTLVMYVYPHLAGPAHVPIPGYTTRFSMYETTEFALPGEVPIHADNSTAIGSQR
jgi:conjugative transfer region lipoprotein (TIGR03751 family)